MNQDVDRELQILAEIASGAPVTQRRLAKKLGVALGLTNLLIQRLAKKGYIEIVNVQRNRVKYLITPGGIAEKARLTYEYLEYSLRFYRQVHTFLNQALTARAVQGKRVLMYGSGEVAAIAYVVLQQHGCQIAWVVDGRANARPFLNHPVRALADVDLHEADLIVVAPLTDREATRHMLLGRGIRADRVVAIPDVPELIYLQAEELRALANQ